MMSTTTPAVPRPGQLPHMHDDVPAWSARARLASNDPATRRIETGLYPGDDEPDAPVTLPTDDTAVQARLDQMTAGLPLDELTRTLLAGAVQLGEDVADRRAYSEGYAAGLRGEWWWGFWCGGCAIGLLVLVGINLGRHLGWWWA